MKRKGLRENIVEGLFYPSSREQLEKMLEPLVPQGRATFGLFPHGDWDFIYPLLETGWPHLIPQADKILLISSVHRQWDRGIFLPKEREFQSPLGALPVDTRSLRQLSEGSSLFSMDGRPHEEEHGLEILLPLISHSYGEIPLVPMLTGSLQEKEINEAGAALKEWASEQNNLLVLVTANGKRESPDGGEPFCGKVPLGLLSEADLLPEKLTRYGSRRENYDGRIYDYESWGG